MSTPSSCKISLALDWTPNTNHVGIYVAESLGYYEAAGLTVKLLPYAETAPETLVSKGIPILTVEDHSIRGGFGSCVLEACNEHGLDARQIHRLAMPDSWVYQAERSEQLAEVGLDASSIASKVRALISAPMREFTNA